MVCRQHEPQPSVLFRLVHRVLVALRAWSVLVEQYKQQRHLLSSEGLVDRSPHNPAPKLLAEQRPARQGKLL